MINRKSLTSVILSPYDIERAEGRVCFLVSLSTGSLLHNEGFWISYEIGSQKNKVLPWRLLNSL